METIARLRLWLRARPQLIDPAVALGCFLLATPISVVTAILQHGPAWRAVGGLALTCLPLLVRSRWPRAVVAATVAVEVARTLLIPYSIPPPAATAVALYTVATRTTRLTAWLTGFAAIVPLLLIVPVSSPGPAGVQQMLSWLAWTLLGVAVGDAVRSHRQVLAAALDRAERAEREREAEAQRRVGEERLRIARELHDVVAHHITLVNAQASVAHHLVGTNPGLADQALERIRDTSRSALDDLRATVGLLRGGETAATRDPVPGLARLPDLMDSFRHAGLNVTVEESGERADLSPLTDLTAYRIIQEALTNTHKHAGTTSAHVRLQFRPDLLRLSIIDDGRGSAAIVPGNGMIGMYERVKAIGGTLTTDSRAEGGFRVVAELPRHPGRKDSR